MHPAIVEAAKVSSRDPEVNAANFHISHLLSFDDGMADVFLGHGGIGDFAFADTARAGLAEANDIKGAIGAQVANDRADFGRADFQSNDNRGRVKHAFSWFAGVLAAWAARWTEGRRPRST